MKNEIVVLITGCSTGMGRDLCNILSNKGYTVIATARNVETLKDLSAALKLPLDVTHKKSVSDAINTVISKYKKIDILVNNAGYSTRGTLEETDIEKIKSMFEVNVFGILNMIQAVVPEMRKKQGGKVINVGSISGKFAQPINGGYCASKFAVEALSDALRLELRGFNIQSTVIEPGPIGTNFFKTMEQNSNDLMLGSNSCYSKFYESDVRYRSKQKLTPSKTAAQEIANIIMKKRLKARYKVAVPLASRMVAHLPDALKEYSLKKVLG